MPRAPDVSAIKSWRSFRTIQTLCTFEFDEISGKSGLDGVIKEGHDAPAGSA
jgi:hypothetical protein